MTAPIRARCPVCGKHIALRKDGTLRIHNGNEYVLGRWATPCDGEGQPPAPTPPRTNP